MGLTALYTLLWLVSALTFTTQDLMSLDVSPKVTAECGQQVTLNCSAVSSQKGLLVREMHWYLNENPLCSVNNEGSITYSNPHRNLSCECTHGQLSLIIKEVQPLESGDTAPYKCKIKSNKGVKHGTTIVELQECSGEVQGETTDEGYSCTFNHVYPDGDVHWFDGSNHVLDSSLHNTTKQVVQGGWLTIRSYLKLKESGVPYNCSLMSTKSSRHIASTLINGSETRALNPGRVTSGVGSWTSMRTFLYISIFLALSLK